MARKRKPSPNGQAAAEPAADTATAPPQTKKALILAYAKEHKGIGPKAIAAALAVQGVHVSTAQISTTLSLARRKRPARAARAQREPDLFAQLVTVKRMADAMGGIDAAREALDALAKLTAA